MGDETNLEHIFDEKISLNLFFYKHINIECP